MSDPAAVVRRAQQRYWRRNLTAMFVLLGLWAVVGLGCGVLFADVLNDAGSVGGVPLGFWFAQQGSILTFVFIILVYAVTMNRLDDRYHREVNDAKAQLPSSRGLSESEDPDQNSPTAKPQAADAEGGDA